MKKSRMRLMAIVSMASSLMLTIAACGPGASTASQTKLGDVSKDVASAGKVTLVVWDQNTDGGMPQAQKELNAEFQKKYPNVTIKRNSQSFSDLKTTLKLALSSNNPPDVVQANQGYPDMGAFIQAGMIRPVDDYAKLYDWSSYYPSKLLKLNSFSKDGKTWQGKSLYGISQTGELVGVYYNKTLMNQLGLKPPTTITELQSEMAVAKKAGIQPLSFGDLDKYPGIHLFGFVQSAMAGSTYVNDLVKGSSGSWTSSATVKAATTIQNWVEKGYITQDANGVSADSAASDFTSGKALFNVNGTWQQQTYAAAMGNTNVGFVTMDTKDGKPSAMGGEGLAWAITSKSKHPDVAAAYIDFVNTSHAAQVLLKTGNLPSVLPSSYEPEKSTLAASIATQYRKVQKADGVVPYLDYTTSTFYDTLTAGMQNLIARQSTPTEFTGELQKDYASFLDKQ
ncbi:MAG: extracellular solute-binding protein [Bifidobacterium sp.]|uniref:extracellular solute-binding protein n=1 Tax=Bifidobacterium sp. TaxID=41200 RepID=UPI0039E93B74